MYQLAHFAAPSLLLSGINKNLNQIAGRHKKINCLARRKTISLSKVLLKKAKFVVERARGGFSRLSTASRTRNYKASASVKLKTEFLRRGAV